MLVPTLLSSLVSLVSLTRSVAADQRITAKTHSWGGVNYPSLQFFHPKHRHETVKALYDNNVRVIRLFIRPDEHHPDVEGELGGFDKSLLDQFDDTLATIYHISNGEMKVIIAPHDAHALRGDNDVPCDAYCKKLNGAFLDFYSGDEYREHYKTRLDVLFKHYTSKNFGQRPWSELSEIILGVDIQNQPFSDIWPIPAGESWICDIANHLKYNLGLDLANIAVISGGISGPQTVDGIENFPDSAFDCAAIDVIGIHGYYKKEEDATAGTKWAQMLTPGNTLTARAKDKRGKGKLLLVEEWSYINTKWGLHYKQEALFDQANALNLRGIPWLYANLITVTEGTSTGINPLMPDYTAWPTLKDALKRAAMSRSNYDWSKYIPPPPNTGLTNRTALPLNSYIPGQSDCTFGCEGHLCDAADGCAPHLICKNSICQQNDEDQPGQVGAKCNSKKLCQEHLRCSGGECQACSARPSIQSKEPPRKRTIAGELPPFDPYRTKIVANDINASCYTNSLPTLFELIDSGLVTADAPICLAPSGRGNPCENAKHCDANEYCSWGLCKKCTDKDACLGAKCKSNNTCKTGFCNKYNRCGYPGEKTHITGPGARARSRNRRIPGVPKGHEEGPAKVRDEAMRIRIPEEKIAETAKATAS